MKIPKIHEHFQEDSLIRFPRNFEWRSLKPQYILKFCDFYKKRILIQKQKSYGLIRQAISFSQFLKKVPYILD